MNYLDWIRELGREHRFGPGDRLGSLNHIDDAARQRAADAVRTGRSAGLAKQLREAESLRHDGLPGYEITTFYSDEPAGIYTDRSIGTGTEHVRFDCHGIHNTHIDALNHTAVDGTWYGGIPVDAADAPSVLDQAQRGVFTRALYLDIAGARGAEWVDTDEPVTAAEIEAAISALGESLLPGDALVLDMGRDRYEAAGYGVTDSTRPGVGSDAARWLARQPISALVWDFLDAKHPSEPPACVHLLNWAIGLVLVDNCSFAVARELVGPAGGVAALSAAPLPMAGATGCNVNPLLVV